MAKRKLKRKAKTVARAKRSSNLLENQTVQIAIVVILLCILFFAVYGGKTVQIYQ